MCTGGVLRQSRIALRRWQHGPHIHKLLSKMSLKQNTVNIPGLSLEERSLNDIGAFARPVEKQFAALQEGLSKLPDETITVATHHAPVHTTDDMIHEKYYSESNPHQRLLAEVAPLSQQKQKRKNKHKSKTVDRSLSAMMMMGWEEEDWGDWEDEEEYAMRRTCYTPEIVILPGEKKKLPGKKKKLPKLLFSRGKRRAVERVVLLRPKRYG